MPNHAAAERDGTEGTETPPGVGLGPASQPPPTVTPASEADRYRWHPYRGDARTSGATRALLMPSGSWRPSASMRTPQRPMRTRCARPSCSTTTAPTAVSRTGRWTRPMPSHFLCEDDPQFVVRPADRARRGPDHRVGKHHAGLLRADRGRGPAPLPEGAGTDVHDDRQGIVRAELRLHQVFGRRRALLGFRASWCACPGGSRGGAGEGLAHLVALEPQVDADGLGLGDLPLQMLEDRPQAGRIRRQVGHDGHRAAPPTPARSGHASTGGPPPEPTAGSDADAAQGSGKPRAAGRCSATPRGPG